MSNSSTTVNNFLSKQARQAQLCTDQIAAAAADMVDLMTALHGGEWKADISHEYGAEFILVRPRSRKAGAK